MIKRAPVFLRVTQQGEKIDALDQLSDSPLPDEKLFAYRITGAPGHVHLNIRGGRGGFYPVGEYRLVANQPPDEVMRDVSAWALWCNNSEDYGFAGVPDEKARAAK